MTLVTILCCSTKDSGVSSSLFMVGITRHLQRGAVAVASLQNLTKYYAYQVDTLNWQHRTFLVFFDQLTLTKLDVDLATSDHHI
jgi:hypothetical protein